MSDYDVKALGARAEKMIRTLAPMSSEPDKLVRLFLSKEHRRAADQAAVWMREAGLDVSEDALGTVHGRSGDGPRLIVGSHLDSVIDAGHYDGPLGVIAAIIAADEVRKRGIKIALDVVAFGDEEGSRFPSTLSSSSALAGHFEHETLKFADSNGVTFEQALKAYGKDPADIPSAALKKSEAAAYVELHIEQGPRLEAANEPLGVVTGIVGQSRWRTIVKGEAGHAGTVPMPMRRDALLGAAEMALSAEKYALSQNDMVATVGRIEARPGATNIIPGEVVFTVDLRSMDDAVRNKAFEALKDDARKIAKARKLDVTFEPFHAVDATPCDPRLQDLLAASITDLGHKPLRLSSGAGHDGQAMAKLCPSAMMFVRCREGISHNPAEFTSEADMGEAIAALIRFIERFAARANA